MLRAGKAKHGMFDRYQKLGMASFEAAGQRAFADIFDDIVANKPPELSWRNPNIALITDDSG